MRTQARGMLLKRQRNVDTIYQLKEYFYPLAVIALKNETSAHALVTGSPFLTLLSGRLTSLAQVYNLRQLTDVLAYSLLCM
jgi:hypothetical protein